MDINEKPLRFYYRNYKGECGYRSVVNPMLHYGETPYHKGQQWLLQAFDLDKDDIRDFAVADIIEFVREV